MYNSGTSRNGPLANVGQFRFDRSDLLFLGVDVTRQGFQLALQLVAELLLGSRCGFLDRRSGGHPAKKSFQAIRVEVNHELDVLRASLEEAISLLNPGGRISVITFQSLEDKIVKQTFKKYSEVEIPRGMPVVPEGIKPTLRLVNRKPITASEEELAQVEGMNSLSARQVYEFFHVAKQN